MPSGSPQSTLSPGWDSCEAAGEVARPRLSEQLYGLSRSRGTGEALYGAPGRRSPIPVPEKAHNCDGRFNYLHHQHSLFHQHLVANQVRTDLEKLNHCRSRLLGRCKSSFQLQTVLHAKLFSNLGPILRVTFQEIFGNERKKVSGNILTYF